MKNNPFNQKGLSLVEFMVAIAIGLFLVASLLSVYLVQSQTYKTTASQGFIQNAENAISEMLTSYIIGAGFAGCSTVINAVSNLNGGGSPPLGTINTAPSMIMGYQATTGISQVNAANDSVASHWSPSLDATLAGNAESGSDVLVVFGAIPNSSPVGITTISSGSALFAVQNSTGISVGQLGAISDCSKASIFAITAVSGTNISHSSSGGSYGNASSTLAVNYPVGAQFIPMQQTAFFVGQGNGGQSSLMMATLNGSTWTVQAIVPGVDTMKVLYGIGSNGVLTQYVTAPNVPSWGEVYAINLGFLIEGQAGSGSYSNRNQTQFNILNQTVTIPADNRLRHVFQLTINVRNAIS